MDPRISGSLGQYPDAIVVYEEDGSWALKCSKCGGEQFWAVDSIEHDVMVLERELCISEKIAGLFPDKNIPICDGRTTYILVKKDIE